VNNFIGRLALLSLFEIRAKLRRKKLTLRAKDAIIKYLQANELRKLHIGSGGIVYSGWINSDLDPQSGEIVFLDASRPFPVPDNSFHFIYSEHVFEHITYEGQKNYLAECMRILNPGGTLRIATPDFDFLIRLGNDGRSETENDYLDWNLHAFLPQVEKDKPPKDERAVYVINNYFKDWGHQLIHNKGSLHSMIEKAGFSNIRFIEVGESARPELRNLEQHDKMITDRFNRLETMIIEADKP